MMVMVWLLLLAALGLVSLGLVSLSATGAADCAGGFAVAVLASVWVLLLLLVVVVVVGGGGGGGEVRW